MVIDSGATVDAEAFLDAAYTAGQLPLLGVHSTVMKQLATLDLIEFIKGSEGKVILTTY